MKTETTRSFEARGFTFTMTVEERTGMHPMYKFHGIQELSVGLFARIYIRNATPHLPLDNCMGFAIWMETADGQSVGIEVGNPTTWRGIKGCFTKAHREYLESVQA